MLIELNAKFTKKLITELEALSESDKRYFHPHKFDVDSIRNLSKERGNHYYIYRDNLGDFAGYGMLRTFGKYEIPTLGCVIWVRYRKRGNGTELVKELVEKAKELGYYRIRLKVHLANKTAYEMYKRIGFMSINRIEDDQIWMEYK